MQRDHFASWEDQATSEITEIMNDFKPILCVIVYKNSPFGYSLINEIHRHSPAAKESENWKLLEMCTEMCAKNWIFHFKKSTVEFLISRMSNPSSIRASAFYGTQASICEAFKAYSLCNKRRKIKVSLTYIVANLLPKICANW